MNHRDLGHARGRKRRLVVEDPAEMLAVGKHFVLRRQERAAALHEVHARQPVLARDLLRAQMLLDGDRIVSAALDGGIVGDDDALAAADSADAADDARASDAAAVHAVGGELRQLEERAAGIQEYLDALAGGELARGTMTAHRLPRATLGRAAHFSLELGGEPAHGRLIVAIFLRAGIEPGRDAGLGLVTMA